MKALFILSMTVLATLGGCTFGKNTANNMAITAQYDKERLKHLEVVCGRDRDIDTSIDKAVVK